MTTTKKQVKTPSKPKAQTPKTVSAKNAPAVTKKTVADRVKAAWKALVA
jgi:hypothetical protein